MTTEPYTHHNLLELWITPRDDGAVHPSESSGSLVSPRDDGAVHPSESSGKQLNPGQLREVLDRSPRDDGADFSDCSRCSRGPHGTKPNEGNANHCVNLNSWSTHGSVTYHPERETHRPKKRHCRADLFRNRDRAQ